MLNSCSIFVYLDSRVAQAVLLIICFIPVVANPRATDQYRAVRVEVWVGNLWFSGFLTNYV